MNKLRKRAIDFCIQNKHRLTKSRLNVLEIISSSNKPMKAYEILSKLSKFVKNPKPPTVYRAIDFWKKINFIHKIERLKAYTACDAAHLHQGTQFMICDDCGVVIESHFCKLPLVIQQAIEESRFVQKSWNLEITGICKRCS